MKTSLTDVCFRHLSNLYRLQELYWNKYTDYRLIPVRVLSCVVRQFDYEYDHVRRHLRLFPLMADETDAGMEAPALGECEAYWRSFRLEPCFPYVFLWRRWIV